MGLHCLNGRSSTEETERRRQILTNAAWGSFEFGLAIHPYGDSFAHRNLDHPDEMYPSGLGHAVEILHLRNPHCPDFMNRRQPLYFDYAKGLYTIVCDKTPDIHDRPLLKADLETQLRKVAAEKGDSKQIEKLRQLAPGCLFGQTLNDYCPEKQEKLAAWTDFQRTYQGVVELPPDLLRQALQFARGWQASR
jgi:hypothetical protein